MWHDSRTNTPPPGNAPRKGRVARAPGGWEVGPSGAIRSAPAPRGDGPTSRLFGPDHDFRPSPFVATVSI